MSAGVDHKKHIAPLAAAAAWGMGQWELMDSYLSVMKPHSPDRSFFGAILSIHRNQFEEAHRHITKARDGLDQELSALLGESYTRAYGIIVRVQMLAELEEIEQGLAEGLRRGIPPQSTALNPLVARHRDWVTTMWNQPAPLEAYAGLADTYLAHPDFIAHKADSNGAV